MKSVEFFHSVRKLKGSATSSKPSNAMEVATVSNCAYELADAHYTTEKRGGGGGGVGTSTMQQPEQLYEVLEVKVSL